MKKRLSLAGATLTAVALAASTLLATAGTAQAADTATITVNVVDQFGQPTAVAIEAFDHAGNSYFDSIGGSVQPILATHVFHALPADGYSFLSIGPWSGVECFGIAPCGIGSGVYTPVVTVTEGGTASYTAHVTMPTATGGPAVGTPLSIQTSPGYQLMQGLAVAQTHVSADHTQQWVRGTSDIPAANGTSYVTVPADGGQQLAARLTPSPAVSAVFAGAGYVVPPFTTRPVAVAKNATKTKASFVHGVIKVKVKSAPGVVPDGKVKLSLGTFKTKAKLKKGKASVALPHSLKPGTYTLKVTYPGSTAFEKSKSKKVTITVH